MNVSAISSNYAEPNLKARERMLIWCDSKADGIVRMREDHKFQVCIELDLYSIL